jgi:N-sulfoglucosamine sulfohydrolase
MQKQKKKNSMFRRNFLKSFAAYSTLFSFGSQSCKNPKTDRPNIILFIGDDISVDDFGCYGHPTIRTPHVDRLAQSGVRFTNAYLTTSQCSPTRCSIITGRYPHNTGAPELHMDLPEGQHLFPQEMKKAGYYCAQAGKWHLGEWAKQAFDNVYAEELGGLGGEERWVSCLQERPQDQPFFMWFSSHDAHRGWHPGDEVEKHNPKDAIVPPYMVDVPNTRTDLAKYYDEVARLDYYVGRVMEELISQDELEKTIILFMADNGRPFPRCKTWLYDSGIKTPLVLSWPQGLGTDARVCNSLVSAIDIAPTILDLIGLKSPKTVQGKSFTTLLDNPEKTVCEYVFAERNWHTQRAHERMVRWENWVYIRNSYPELNQLLVVQRKFPAFKDMVELNKKGQLTEAQRDLLLAPRPAEQLFYVDNDPDQLVNVIQQKENKEVLAHLRKALDEWQDRTGDTAPPLDKVTPDRHDLVTGERLYEGWRPPTGILPGEEKNAAFINDPGPR